MAQKRQSLIQLSRTVIITSFMLMLTHTTLHPMFKKAAVTTALTNLMRKPLTTDKSVFCTSTMFHRQCQQLDSPQWKLVQNLANVTFNYTTITDHGACTIDKRWAQEVAQLTAGKSPDQIKICMLNAQLLMQAKLRAADELLKQMSQHIKIKSPYSQEK